MIPEIPKEFELCANVSTLCKIAAQNCPSPCILKIKYDKTTPNAKSLIIYVSGKNKDPTDEACEWKKDGGPTSFVIASEDVKFS